MTALDARGRVQLMLRIFGYGRNPQTAADAPRWQIGEGRSVMVEEEVAESVCAVTMPMSADRAYHFLHWLLHWLEASESVALEQTRPYRARRGPLLHSREARLKGRP